MNYGVVTKVLGNLLVLEALLMVPSLIVSLIYGQTDSFRIFDIHGNNDRIGAYYGQIWGIKQYN